MNPDKFVAYEEKFAAYGSTTAAKLKDEVTLKKNRPTLFVLAGSLLVPLLLFAVTFWLRSFELHYKSEIITDTMCYFLFLVPLAFGALAFRLVQTEADAKPMMLLAGMSLLACVLGFVLGGRNYHKNMQPFYDLNRLNVYPSVDPSKYGGQQLLDAAQIQFTPGTKVNVKQSTGFKDGETYCVAPIVSGGNATQSTLDFWAVGTNCCSGHAPDFHCGEYMSPFATKGLRLMDPDKRDMFRLVVKKAEAEFNLKVSHPIFLYWLSDPDTEVSAYQDDGWQQFVGATFGFFCVQLCVVVCAAAVFAKM